MQRSRFIPAAFPSCGTNFQFFSTCESRSASAVDLGDTIQRPDATVEATSAGKGQRVLVLLWSAFSPLIYYLTWQAEWMSGRGLCRGSTQRAALPSFEFHGLFCCCCLIIKKLHTNNNKNPAEMLSDQIAAIFTAPPLVLFMIHQICLHIHEPVGRHHTGRFRYLSVCF